MAVLSDSTIRRLIGEGRIGIDPFEDAMVQPASVDLRLGDSFGVCRAHRIERVDLGDPPADFTEQVTVPSGEPFVIHPGEFCLGTTAEVIRLPADILARVEGKSSIGRLGLTVHVTAGFIDPGFEGEITLEFCNLTRVPLLLRPGKAICQVSFETMDRPADRPYGHPDLGSHYQGQRGATASRYGQ